MPRLVQEEVYGGEKSRNVLEGSSQRLVGISYQCEKIGRVVFSFWPSFC